MSIDIREVPFDDPDVQKLVGDALADLAERYGSDDGDSTPVDATEFVAPHGRFLAAFDGDLIVGCAGWRSHGPDAELKRMYIAPAARGRGLARQLLARVEETARDAGRTRVILETGDRQPEAIALYTSSGYTRIADFGYYRGEPGVRSFARAL